MQNLRYKMVTLIFRRKIYIFLVLLFLLIVGIFLPRFLKEQPRETASFSYYITEKCEKDITEGKIGCLYETLSEIVSVEGTEVSSRIMRFAVVAEI